MLTEMPPQLVPPCLASEGPTALHDTFVDEIGLYLGFCFRNSAKERITQRAGDQVSVTIAVAKGAQELLSLPLLTFKKVQHKHVKTAIL